MVEAIAEERTVRKLCKRVVERLPRQFLLELQTLGHVARVQHNPAYLPVFAEIADVSFEHTPAARGIEHSENELVRLGELCGGALRREAVRLDDRSDDPAYS